MPSFASLGLAEPLLRALTEEGYDAPTPIQQQAIPVALAGRDLTGCAQTGTGKTAAFVLPLLHRLLRTPVPRGRRPVRALVVTPTRELALQVEESVRVYGRHTGLRSAAVFGGVGTGAQLEAFRRGVDVLVATPGRLLDHLGAGALRLDAVEVLVLDEADRMFDMGFVKDVRRIVAAVPARRQTLLFSATMPPPIEALARSVQHDPALVEVGARRDAAATVAQHVYAVPQEHKTDLLLHVLARARPETALVFTRTKHRADRLTRKLGRAGVPAAALHSDRSQNQRQRALAQFKDGALRVLVATDIAARGIDVDGLALVVNFDTPGQPEDYVHRIGRTGRAEATGDALTFVAPEEESALHAIEKFTGRRLALAPYPGFSPPPAAASVPPHPATTQTATTQTATTQTATTQTATTRSPRRRR
ncbi:MAG: DEAD/DEAH box helicase [Rubricoccaceae bacterium]